MRSQFVFINNLFNNLVTMSQLFTTRPLINLLTLMDLTNMALKISRFQKDINKKKTTGSIWSKKKADSQIIKSF